MASTDMPRRTQGVEKKNRRSWSSARDSISKSQLDGKTLQLDNSVGFANYRSSTRRSRQSSAGHTHRLVLSSSVARAPQLANIKKQWDIERDIPDGTVRNNPFSPKPQRQFPSQTPPQLLHQKKQWDTRDIPRGAVASRVLRTEGTNDDIGACSGYESGRAHAFTTSPTADTSRSPRLRTEGSGLFDSSRSVGGSSSATTALRGRLIENPYLQRTNTSRLDVPSQGSSQIIHLASSRWAPSLEIPKGTVKGRVNTLFRKPRSDERKAVSAHKVMLDEDSVVERWQVSTQTSLALKADISTRDCNEDSATKPSQASFDWEGPVQELLPFPSNDLTAFKAKEAPKFQSKHQELLVRDFCAQREISASFPFDTRSPRNFSRPSEESDDLFPVIDKKNANEDESVTQNRDADVLETARQKQLMSELSGTIPPSDGVFKNPEESEGISRSQAHVTAMIECKPEETTDFTMKHTESLNLELFNKADIDRSGPTIAASRASTTLKLFPSSCQQECDSETRFSPLDPELPNQSAVESISSVQSGNLRKVSSKMRIEDSTTVSEVTLPTIFGGVQCDAETLSMHDPVKLKNSRSPFQFPQSDAAFRKECKLQSEYFGLNSTTFGRPNSYGESDEVQNTQPSVLDSTLFSKEIEIMQSPPTGDPDFHQLDSLDAIAAGPQPERNQVSVVVPAIPDQKSDCVTAKKRRMQKLRKFSKLGLARLPTQGFLRMDQGTTRADEYKDVSNEAPRLSTPESCPQTPQSVLNGRSSLVSKRFCEDSSRRAHLTSTNERDMSVETKADAVHCLDVTSGSPLSRSHDNHQCESSEAPKSDHFARNENICELALSRESRPTHFTIGMPMFRGVPPKSDRCIESSSSVGSDIRILRSILRRPRRSTVPMQTLRLSKQTFTAYDENTITDPMQRAGLRLLSAAIIPIQTEVRRFLAMRRALTRMWALIVIQTYWRRWGARCRYLSSISSVVKLQSIIRGFTVRITLQDRSACAIEIQRCIRGYLATMKVYEEIYRVTIVQSLIRMKLAINLATHRMARVIHLQAIARGFLDRRRFTRTRTSAIKIQASWRCFYIRLGYQFDLLDIIISQSAWRRRCARREACIKRRVLWERCSTLIQSQWRSYDCTMNYLHYLADVLVVQSAVRRFLVRKRVARYRHHAATTIQCAARGLISRRSLLEFLSARKIQTLWRGYICYHGAKAFFAARCIQAHWRGYVSFRDATGAIAARLIQAHWRGGLSQRHFLRYKAARVIQTYWRRFVCYRKTTKFYAARAIQTSWRRHRCIRLRQRYYSSRTIQRIWRGFVCVMDLKEYYAARKIQSAWRSFVCYADFMFTIADVVIVQKLARRWLAARIATARRNEKAQDSAKAIQLAWRSFYSAKKIQRFWLKFRFLLTRERAATIIQKTWRGFVDETEYVVLRYESYAARTIQTYWRRFWCFSNFIIALDCSIQIQAVFRGFIHRRALKFQRNSAASIQSCCRIFLAKHEASRVSMIQALILSSNSTADKHSAAATSIQRLYKGVKVRHAVGLYRSARNIQCLIRGRQARIAVRLYQAARSIQRTWRGFHPRRIYELYVAARCIQNFWRCKSLSSKYRLHRAAVVLQSFWRCKLISVAYRLYRSALKIQTKFRSVKACQDVKKCKRMVLAAVVIQSAWRGFVCYTDYIFTIADIVAVQKVVRGYLARSVYADTIKSRIIQRRRRFGSVTLIQKVCRGFICRQRYWYTLGCTMQIQSWLRGRLVIVSLRREAKARISIQSAIRRFLAKQEVSQRQFIYMLIQSAELEKLKAAAARKIQMRWKHYVLAKSRQDAARAIQRFFLMVKLEVDRMVFAAKRRHEWRRRLKNRANRNEDALLEDAWQSAVSKNIDSDRSSPINSSSPYLKTQQFLNDQQPHNTMHYVGAESAKPLRVRLCSERIDCNHGVLRQVATQNHRLPPNRLPADKPSSVVRLQDDDHSELSGLTASTAANYLRIPPSRVSKLSSVEIEEDMELEEAFIDAEISNAKERRLSESNWVVLPVNRSRSSARHPQGSICSSRRKVRASDTPTAATPS